MKEKLLKNTGTCLLIFLILLIVHAFEAIVLRMDETFFATMPVRTYARRNRPGRQVCQGLTYPA